jgi:hypothetical protein
VTRSTRLWPPDATIWRVASIPSISGILASITTTSGRRLAVSRTASAPSPASPATAIPGSRSTSIRNASRCSRWSSATSTLIITRTLPARPPPAGPGRRPAIRPSRRLADTLRATARRAHPRHGLTRRTRPTPRGVQARKPAPYQPGRKLPGARRSGPSALTAVLGPAGAAIVLHPAAVVQIIAITILAAAPVLCLRPSGPRSSAPDPSGVMPPSPSLDCSWTRIIARKIPPAREDGTPAGVRQDRRRGGGPVAKVWVTATRHRSDACLGPAQSRWVAEAPVAPVRGHALRHCVNGSAAQRRPGCLGDRVIFSALTACHGRSRRPRPPAAAARAPAQPGAAAVLRRTWPAAGQPGQRKRG